MAIRNLATRRKGGTQIAARAGSKISNDSATVNQTEGSWPDSRQIISGSVLAMTAAHATMRGKGSEDGGVAGFIGRADFAAAFRRDARGPRSIFRVREFRSPDRGAIRAQRGCNRGRSCCL